jgi:hypothetical protein
MLFKKKLNISIQRESANHSIKYLILIDDLTIFFMIELKEKCIIK